VQNIVEAQCEYLTRYPERESRSVALSVTAPMQSPCIRDVQAFSNAGTDCRTEQASNTELFHNPIFKLLVWA
jgi:hypothetical protein